MAKTSELVNRAHPGPSVNRSAFWLYCKRAINASQTRARDQCVPHSLTANDIDCLLVDQGWRCAVSDIPLDTPCGDRQPFSPSLDRIVPALGYVPGNVRVVCNLVNFAMNKWGEEPLMRLVSAIREGR